MSDATDQPSASNAAAASAEAFRHLPDAISVEETMATIPGEVPTEFGGEPNAFIAAAVAAGG